MISADALAAIEVTKVPTTDNRIFHFSAWDDIARAAGLK